MQTIGERLEEARKRKGVSIREAAEATKIRGDYLQKFESNQFDLGLAELYVRGFLRSYAQFLRMPADKIVNDFNGLGVAARSRARNTPSREVYGRMDLSVASAEENVAVEGAAAPEGEPAPAARNPASFTRGGGSLALGPSISPNLVIKGGVALAGLVVLAVVVWGVKAVVSRSSPAPAAHAMAVQPAPVDPAIAVVALAPVRVKVVAKDTGEVLLDASLAANETRTVPKKGALYLTASELANVALEENGTRINLRDRGLKGHDRILIDN